MRIAGMGRVAFALVMVTLGVLGLIKGDFVPVWEPVPKDIPARELLALLCATLSLTTGLGLLWRRAAGAAARLLLAFLILWFLVFRVPALLRAIAIEGSWSGCAETAVILAGAWTLYAAFAPERDIRFFGFATGARGLRIARIVFGLALIPFGLAHFAYLSQTVALVPGWLPWPAAWAYLTGAAYIAAAVAILAGVAARLAASLAALQMGLFTLLVWAPIIAAGATDRFQWSETVLSAALTAAGWVIAEFVPARACGVRVPRSV